MPPPPDDSGPLVWMPPRLRKLYLAGTANGSDPAKDEPDIWEGSNPAINPGLPTTNYRMPLSGEPL